MRRIVVVGTSGAGKTTFARALAQRLNVPHIELDALHWEPNWVEATLEVFRTRVELATREAAWILDGNYGEVRDIVWQRADTIVWLDYALAVVMWRIWWRTWRRVLHREELWNGNRENVRTTFFSRDSILLWALTTYHRRRREYSALLAHPTPAHLQIIQLRSPHQADVWLAQFSETR